MRTRMKRATLGAVLAVALLVTAPATLPACSHPTPATITTPQGAVAYQIEDLVDALGVIQHAAINASHAGVTPRPIALKVTRSTRAMARTLDAAIDTAGNPGSSTSKLFKNISAGLAALADDPDLVRFRAEITVAQHVASVLAGGVQ